ncbi:MAG: hypothetical protein AAGA58_14730 [Verrucomicrobiota bacterium]
MFDSKEEVCAEPIEVQLGRPTDEWPLAAKARLRQGDRRTEINFRFTRTAPVEPPLVQSAMLPLALVPAMKLGSPLRIEGSIDDALPEGAARFQEIFSSWYPEYTPVPIEASTVTGKKKTSENDKRGVGLFFSGGVDSMYSLLKHRDEITHAIFVHGCDIPLQERIYRERISRHLQAAADDFGVKLVEVETNLLDFSNLFGHWGYHYHGCGLAAIAILLSGTLRKVLIASSDPYSLIVPWGSSYITDPLWSSAALELVHDGSECDRLDKTRIVANNETALKYLRVCFENPTKGQNCGRCEKCYRTMIGLRLCQALEHCPAFNEPLDLNRMLETETVLREAGQMRAWRILREEATRQNTDSELIAALDALFDRAVFYDMVRNFSQNKKEITAMASWKESLPKFRSVIYDSLRENDPSWFAGKTLKWLPEIRDRVFHRLWANDRHWLSERCRSARWNRLLSRFQKRRKRPGNVSKS